MPEEITVSDAVKRYWPQISNGHLNHLLKREVIKGRKVGPIYLVDVDSLEYWLANRPKRGGYRGRKPKKTTEEASHEATTE